MCIGRLHFGAGPVSLAALDSKPLHFFSGRGLIFVFCVLDQYNSICNNVFSEEDISMAATIASVVFLRCVRLSNLLCKSFAPLIAVFVFVFWSSSTLRVLIGGGVFS